MKRLLFVMFILISICCCDKKHETVYTTVDNEVQIEDEYDGRCVFRKSRLPQDSIFPFSQADKIEIISYGFNSTENFVLSRIEGVKVLKPSLAVDGINERIELTKAQIDTLFSIFNDYSGGDPLMSADCYSPRHAILFYRNNKLIEYLEICFECQKVEYISKQSSFALSAGSDQWCYLSEYFKKCGLTKNFSEDKCPPSIFCKN